ncbi:MAG: hypothetical protein A2173_09250 [Planctomycetes bacterium RBG_13_44_8b]|nr:MAG: hypothetical protein A2173_09250 [Planctomycetes bacterium RBG_13_44_8b]
MANTYLFTGREYDSETGNYYYRARYYKPSIGRFLQPDPIGYTAGLNMYTYCGNNPVNFVDPYGLCHKSGGWIDWLQGGLDVIGIFDPIGISDAANALIYAGRGQWSNAAISGIAIIPYIGDLGKGGKYGAKALKAADKVNDLRKAADKANDLRKAVDKTSDLRKAVDKTSDLAKYSDEAAELTKNVLKHNDDQAALIKLAKDAKKSGVSADDAETLLSWADEYKLPHRGPEIHPKRPHGKDLHIHIDKQGHIKIK